jgi:hypothetical protein
MIFKSNLIIFDIHKQLLKMKNLLFIFSFFLLFNFSFAQTKNDLISQGLKGKVSFMSKSGYSLVEKFGEIVKGENIWKYTSKYDIKGNRMDLYSYNSYGSMEYEGIFKYDENGNKIEYNEYSPTGSLKETIKYDEKGNLIETINYYTWGLGGISGKTTYEYDAAGNRIETNVYKNDYNFLRLSKKEKYKYDLKGNNIEFIEYNSDGSLSKKETYKYDAKGNNILTNEYKPDGSLDAKKHYKYDVMGNFIGSDCYNSHGKLYRKTSYKYDVKGNEIEYSKYAPFSSPINEKETYKYEFDAMGNWIKKWTIIKGKPKYVEEREIKYY